MALQEGFLIWETNLLQITILAGIFFFGDLIYQYITQQIKDQFDNPIGGFFIALIVIIFLSAIPILFAETIVKFSSVLGWILVVVVLVACFIKFAYGDN